MNNYVAIDTETHLIGKDNIAPPPVCMQVGWLDGKYDALIIEKARPSFEQDILNTLQLEGVHFVFHNASFDLGVLWTHIPATRELIWRLLDEGRIHDTMIREMLYNVTAFGDVDMVTNGAITQRAEYSLAALEKKYLGIDRSKEKDAEDSVRRNYAAVEHLLFKDWPLPFQTYGLEDPVNTLAVFFAQEERGKLHQQNTGYDPYATEAFRVRVAWALQLMTLRGNKLDAEQVLKTTEEFKTAYNDPELVRPLVLSSFIKHYCQGQRATKEVVEALLEMFDEMPLSEQKKWEGTGMVIPADPGRPLKSGAREHLPECKGHKDHPEHPKKAVKDCNCPVKRTKPKAEKGSDKARDAYVGWLGIVTANDPNPVELWITDGTKSSLREQGTLEVVAPNKKKICKEYLALNAKDGLLPEELKLQVNQEWMAEFGHSDYVMEVFTQRKTYQKIITSYLPGLYWAKDKDQCPVLLEGETDKLAGKEPADIIHAQFMPLKATGRTSSRAAKVGKGEKAVYLYPSMNGQQVDPRVRSCVVPREGYVLFSLDYRAMELCTLAQKCINLFGYSVLGDVINAGKDSHAYLGMYIACHLDSWMAAYRLADPLDLYDLFTAMKDEKEMPCPSPDFINVWHSTGHEGVPMMSDFFAHYRKFAKPTGLGYPGGLGPATFQTLAKSSYGVTVDFDTAKLLRDIWKTTYPEMVEYFEYINKQCIDPDHSSEEFTDDDGETKKRTFYAYDTPLGLHRARCNYCACANGMGLQAFSADGALTGLVGVQSECTRNLSSVLSPVNGEQTVFPTIFIHDEIFGEIKDDEFLTQRIERMQHVMEQSMMMVTPDVEAKTEPAIMRRWSKKAYEYRVDGQLRPYEDDPNFKEEN